MRANLIRLEPQTLKGIKISGYLESIDLSNNISDVFLPFLFETDYGGGRYQVRVEDDNGKYLRSVLFDIPGMSKISFPHKNKSLFDLIGQSVIMIGSKLRQV